MLGGDGTFLRAARAVAEVDVPLLGINLGKVGFLSKAEAGDLEAVLELDRRRRVRDRRADGPRGPDPARRRTATPARPTRLVALNDIVVARGVARPRLPARRRDRRYAPRHVHRRRPRRGQPDRLDRLFVLGRRPDPRPGQPEPHRHPDRGLPVGHPVGRGQPEPGRPLHGRRRLRGARLASTAARTSRSPSATSSRSGRWSGRSASSSPRGAQPFWDLLRHKVALLPS